MTVNNNIIIKLNMNHVGMQGSQFKKVYKALKNGKIQPTEENVKTLVSVRNSMTAAHQAYRGRHRNPVYRWLFARAEKRNYTRAYNTLTNMIKTINAQAMVKQINESVERVEGAANAKARWNQSQLAKSEVQVTRAANVAAERLKNMPKPGDIGALNIVKHKINSALEGLFEF